MKRLTRATLILSLNAFLFLHPAESEQPPATRSQPVEWSSSDVQHVYGLPDSKRNDKGTLTLSATVLRFQGRTSSAMIPRHSIIEVTAGDESVEIWGKKGQLLRAVIPDGGGLAAAGVMHHRVGMLTVDFTDPRGGYHGAVFFLPADEAQHAAENLSSTVSHEVHSRGCAGPARPNSVLLAGPIWNEAEVPGAYRALLYEHLFDGLRRVKGVAYVYRDGEDTGGQGCPQYTMQLSISAFKEGSQVKRAMMGPIGFFASTTQMTFDATVTDASGRVAMKEQIKASARGEAENTNVAESIAKKLAKEYSMALKSIHVAQTAEIARQP